MRESAHICESAHPQKSVISSFYTALVQFTNHPTPNKWFLTTWAPMGGFPRDYGISYLCIYSCVTSWSKYVILFGDIYRNLAGICPYSGIPPPSFKIFIFNILSFFKSNTQICPPLLISDNLSTHEQIPTRLQYFIRLYIQGSHAWV